MRLVFLLVLLLAFSMSVEAQTRRALIVGVQEYDQLADLTRTAADAEGYSNAFEQKLDFEVTKLVNPTFDEFLSTLSEFTASIQPDDEVAFIFSGHGWSDGASNYVAMSDAPFQSTELSLRRLTFDLNADILNEFRAREPSLVFAVIDACRDNPFDLGTKSVAKGLIAQQNIPGTLVVYAAGANEKALDRLKPDDPSPYSVFTRTLLPKLSNPKTSLMRAVDKARDETATLASQITHNQRPAVYSDISIDFCFASYCDAASSGKFALLANDEGSALAQALSANTLAAFVEFRDKFPESSHLPLVTYRIAELSPRPNVLQLPPGTVFQDLIKGNRKGPEMVVIPSGSFIMGSPENEAGREIDEGPLRAVHINYQFAAGKYEVTWDEWEACTLDGACDTRDQRADGGDEGYGKGRRPVINVGKDDVEDYVAWLSLQTGESYRLLTEAEWEYAARAGSQERFSWGADDPTCEKGALNRANVGKCPSDRTEEVGFSGRNAFGLYDMHGNVWELVEDCHKSGYSVMPTDGSAVITDACMSPVTRGGAWRLNLKYARSAERGLGSSSRGDYMTGFRVARTNPQ